MSYWLSPGGGNEAVDYWGKWDRSEFLYEFMRGVVPFGAEVMELGCNCGRNIKYLSDRGYTNIFGIDINAGAVAFTKGLPIYCQSIEDFYKGDDIPEMVFSMAVLEHLPIESEWVFEKIAQSRYVLTIEDEARRGVINYPRNYKKIFEGLGMKEIRHQTEDTGLFERKFEARLFIEK